jgi:hypothetical protein
VQGYVSLRDTSVGLSVFRAGWAKVAITGSTGMVYTSGST